MTNLFIFRRDLRIQDNHALNAASSSSSNIMPIFIYNKTRQTSPKTNKYFSPSAFEFMCSCLTDLSKSLAELRIYQATKSDLEILKKILKKHPEINAIYFNADLASPFACSRDAQIAEWCKTNKIECHAITTDYTLIDPTTMEKPYQKFTPFYNKYKDQVEKEIATATRTIKFKPCALKSIQPDSKSLNHRQDAINILKSIPKHFQHYNTTRDEMWKNTTHLSKYLKFGVISIREAYLAAKKNEPLRREFFFRSFYDQVAYHFPRVIDSNSNSNSSFYLKYNNLKWSNNATHLKAWSSGTTGFPLVDAAMRQLLTESYMHNRGRMLVASFLTKTLHIDWRIGERFFAQHLVDYHPSANNGGWQWAAGTGTDAQPYFRTFSPWLQSAKHDPDALYIKKYIPELEQVPAKDIHKWNERYIKFPECKYPRPIVEHTQETKKTMQIYKAIN